MGGKKRTKCKHCGKRFEVKAVITKWKEPEDALNYALKKLEADDKVETENAIEEALWLLDPNIHRIEHLRKQCPATKYDINNYVDHFEFED